MGHPKTCQRSVLAGDEKGRRRPLVVGIMSSDPSCVWWGGRDQSRLALCVCLSSSALLQLAEFQFRQEYLMHGLFLSDTIRYETAYH